jgi:hypothetical protein
MEESQKEEKLDPKKYTVDKEGRLRADFLFSYWVLAWGIIYFFSQKAKDSTGSRFISENMNPIFALIFALIENIGMFIKILIYNPEPSLIFKFLFMMLTIKILPIYVLRNYKVKAFENIMSLVVIFIIYNIYLYSNGKNIYDIYVNADKYILKNENRTTLFQLFHFIQTTLFPSKN